MPIDDLDEQVDLETWERKVFEKHGVPEGLRMSIFGQESGGGKNLTSPTGVKGRYQVTQRTAKQYGLNRDDPWEQPIAAAKYLREGYEEAKKKNPNFGDREAWLAASARYYGGPEAFDGQGNLSSKSLDGLSTPAKYAEGIAKRWSDWERQSQQPAAPRPAAPSQPQATAPQPGRQKVAPPGPMAPRAPQQMQEPNPFSLNAPTGFQQAATQAAQRTANLPTRAPNKEEQDFQSRGPLGKMGYDIKTGYRQAQNALANQVYGLGETIGALQYGDTRPLKEQATGAGLGLQKLIETSTFGAPRAATVYNLRQNQLAQERRRANDPYWVGSQESARRDEARAQANPTLTGKVVRGVTQGAVSAAPILATGAAGGTSAILGMTAATQDYTRPEEAALNIASTVLPIKAGQAISPIAGRLAGKAASSVAGQEVIRRGIEAGTGGATNAAQYAAVQKLRGEQIDPEEMIAQGVTGAALGTAMAPSRRQLGLPTPQKPYSRTQALRQPMSIIRGDEFTAPQPSEPARPVRFGQRPAPAPEAPGTAPLAEAPAPDPGSVRNALRLEADDAKNLMAQFEAEGDFEKAWAEADAAHNALRRLRREASRSRSKTPEDVSYISALDREISYADLARKEYGARVSPLAREKAKAARSAQKAQENAPTAPAPTDPNVARDTAPLDQPPAKIRTNTVDAGRRVATDEGTGTVLEQLPNGTVRIKMDSGQVSTVPADNIINRFGMAIQDDAPPTAPITGARQQTPASAGRRVRVGNEEIDLTPEQAARWAEEVEKPTQESEARYARARQSVNAAVRNAAESRRRGDAMRIAAKKREIADRLTGKEQAAADQRAPIAQPPAANKTRVSYKWSDQGAAREAYLDADLAERWNQINPNDPRRNGRMATILAEQGDRDNPGADAEMRRNATRKAYKMDAAEDAVAPSRDDANNRRIIQGREGWKIFERDPNDDQSEYQIAGPFETRKEASDAMMTMRSNAPVNTPTGPVQEPTNRITSTEYEGGVMNRYSRPLEGAPIETPDPVTAETQPSGVSARPTKRMTVRDYAETVDMPVEDRTALDRALRNEQAENPRPYDDVTRPGEPGSGGVSFSPYNDLVSNNRAKVNQLFGMDLNSPEATQIIADLEGFAANRNIEPRHVENLLNYIKNDQIESARRDDGGDDIQPPTGPLAPDDPRLNPPTEGLTPRPKVEAAQPEVAPAAPAKKRAPESQYASSDEAVNHRGPLYIDRKTNTFVGTQEPLSLEDMQSRGLRPGNFDAMDAYSDQASRQYDNDQIPIGRSQDGRVAIIHPSTKKAGHYQLTRFTDDGIVSDTTFPTRDEAVNDLIQEGYDTRLEQSDAESYFMKSIEAQSSYEARQSPPMSARPAYYVYDTDAKKFVHEPNAKPIQVPGYPDIEFFQRIEKDDNGDWVDIVEASTGRHVAYGRTSDKAAIEARKTLDKLGGDLARKKIAEAPKAPTRIPVPAVETRPRAESVETAAPIPAGGGKTTRPATADLNAAMQPETGPTVQEIRAQERARIAKLTPDELEAALSEVEGRRNAAIREGSTEAQLADLNDQVRLHRARRAELVKAKQLPPLNKKQPPRAPRPVAKEAGPVRSPLDQDVTVLDDETLNKRIRDAERILNVPDLDPARREKVQGFLERAQTEKGKRGTKEEGAKEVAKAKESWEMTRSEYEQAVFDGRADFPLLGLRGAAGETINRLVRSYHQTTDVQNKEIARKDIMSRLDGRHRAEVIKAIYKEGKPVPPEVLADYPDLVKESPAPKPSPESPQGETVKAAPGEAKRVAAKAKEEKIDPRTGLTKTQEGFLTDKLTELAPALADSVGKHTPTTIKVPGDGEFTVSDITQANRLHRRLTGENIPKLDEMVPMVAYNATGGKAREVKSRAKGGAQNIHFDDTARDALRVYGTPERAISQLKLQMERMGEDLTAADRSRLHSAIAKLETQAGEAAAKAAEAKAKADAEAEMQAQNAEAKKLPVAQRIAKAREFAEKLSLDQRKARPVDEMQQRFAISKKDAEEVINRSQMTAHAARIFNGKPSKNYAASDAYMPKGSVADSAPPIPDYSDRKVISRTQLDEDLRRLGVKPADRRAALESRKSFDFDFQVPRAMADNKTGREVSDRRGRGYSSSDAQAMIDEAYTRLHGDEAYAAASERRANLKAEYRESITQENDYRKLQDGEILGDEELASLKRNAKARGWDSDRIGEIDAKQEANRAAKFLGDDELEFQREELANAQAALKKATDPAARARRERQIREAEAKIAEIEDYRAKQGKAEAVKPKFVADAEARLKDASSGKMAGSGGQQLADIAVVAGWRVYRAGIEFADWARAVIDEAGHRVRPYLRDAWDRLQYDAARDAEKDVAMESLRGRIGEAEGEMKALRERYYEADREADLTAEYDYPDKIARKRQRKAGSLEARYGDSVDALSDVRGQVVRTDALETGREIYKPGMSYDAWRRELLNREGILANRFSEVVWDQIQDEPQFVRDAAARLNDAASGKLAGSGARQFADVAIVTGYKAYKAGMKFAEWSKAVIKEAGEDVRPHLRAAWDKITSMRGRDLDPTETGGRVKDVLRRVDEIQGKIDKLGDFYEEGDAQYLRGQKRLEAQANKLIAPLYKELTAQRDRVRANLDRVTESISALDDRLINAPKEKAARLREQMKAAEGRQAQLERINDRIGKQIADLEERISYDESPEIARALARYDAAIRANDLRAIERAGAEVARLEDAARAKALGLDQGFSVGRQKGERPGQVMGSLFGGLQGGSGKKKETPKPIDNRGTKALEAEFLARGSKPLTPPAAPKAPAAPGPRSTQSLAPYRVKAADLGAKPEAQAPIAARMKAADLRANAAEIAPRQKRAPQNAEEYFAEQVAKSPWKDLTDTPLTESTNKEAREALRKAADQVQRGKMADKQKERIIAAADDLMMAGRLGDQKAVRDARKALFDATRGLEDAGKIRRAGATAWDAIKKATRVTQTLAYGTDVSFAFRQAAPLSTNAANILNTARAFRFAYDALGREAAGNRSILPGSKGAESVHETLKAHPMYDLGQKAGLELTLFGKAEEVYADNIATKLPWIKRTEAANEAFLDYMRLQEFQKYVKRIDANKDLTGIKRADAIKQAAEIVNTLTGRTDLGEGAVKRVADAMNGIMAAPRLNVSRLQLVNPVWWGKQMKSNPQVARQLAGNVVGIGATWGSLLALGAATGAFKVNLDPEDKDFGKIVSGETRYDITGGMLPVVKLVYQAGKFAGAAGEEARENTQEATAERKRQQGKTIDRVKTYLRGRLGPLAAYASDLLIYGEDFQRRPVTARGAVTPSDPNNLALRFLPPLGAKSAYESYQKSGAAGIAKTMPAEFFGIGARIYDEDAPGRLDRKSRVMGEADSLGVDFGNLQRKKGEPDNLFKQRSDKTNEWFDNYGQKLLDSAEYKKLDAEDKKKAIRLLRSRVGSEANQVRPNVRSFEPGMILRSLREGERRQERGRSRLIYSPEPE